MAAADGPSALPILHLASTTYRIATGPQAGRRIATIGGGFHAAGSGKAKRLCAEIGGFSLHAATRCRAGDRFRLARLCRYVMRPAFADDQLSWDGAARVTFELKTPWRDGTTHLEMTPIDFMERLAALVPRPRLHLIRFHGVLAPNAKLRAMVVPQSPGSARPRHDCRPPGGADAAASVGRADAPAPRPGLRWADLLRPRLRHRHQHLPELRPGQARAHRDDPRPGRHRPHPRRREPLRAGAPGLKRSASHLRITASPTPDAPRPRPAAHTHGLRRPRSTRIGSEGAATDAPANPNTPGTTR